MIHIVHCDMQVSSLEQEVACSATNLMTHYEAILDVTRGQTLTDDDKSVPIAICFTAQSCTLVQHLIWKTCSSCSSPAQGIALGL